MPELAEVETQKTAGLVNPKKPTPLEDKIKKEEEELEALMKSRTEEIEEKAEAQEELPLFSLNWKAEFHRKLVLQEPPHRSTAVVGDAAACCRLGGQHCHRRPLRQRLAS